MECRKCNIEKQSIDFYPNRRVCKSCHKERSVGWQRQNKDKWQAIVRKSENKQPKEKLKIWADKFHENNPEWKKNYYKENRHIWIVHRRLREGSVKQRTPSWADKQKIKEIYIQAKQSGLVVDHIIPLQGKYVSGLHIETNLQLLTPSENRKKSNKYVVS